MAKFQCDKHGRQGAYIVCFHIAKAVDDNRSLEFISRKDEILGGVQLLCNECYKIREKIENDVELKTFVGELQAICALCLDEWKGRTNSLELG